jgi:hypothetical protein
VENRQGPSEDDLTLHAKDPSRIQIGGEGLPLTRRLRSAAGTAVSGGRCSRVGELRLRDRLTTRSSEETSLTIPSLASYALHEMSHIFAGMPAIPCEKSPAANSIFASSRSQASSRSGSIQNRTTKNMVLCNTAECPKQGGRSAHNSGTADLGRSSLFTTRLDGKCLGRTMLVVSRRELRIPKTQINVSVVPFCVAAAVFTATFRKFM